MNGRAWTVLSGEAGPCGGPPRRFVRSARAEPIACRCRRRAAGRDAGRHRGRPGALHQGARPLPVRANREAIVELDAARALDPKAKDLVFNLGVVHEKLGDIDEALRYARLYSQMDLEPAERARANSY